MPIQPVEFRVELRVGDGLFVLGRQFVEGVGQGLGHIAAAERPKAAGGIGNVGWKQAYGSARWVRGKGSIVQWPPKPVKGPRAEAVSGPATAGPIEFSQVRL